MKVRIECKDGVVREERVYSIYDFPYDKYMNPLVVMKGSRTSYFRLICTFDIESTSIDCRPHATPYAFMYAWQACVEEDVVFGRTWSEYIEFINKLIKYTNASPTTKLVIYVHNLAYEFQFMKDFFEWENIFAKDVRKVLRASTLEVEYRCSLALTNKNLSKLCEKSPSCIHWKQDGEKFNYTKRRTPSTILSEYENSYRYCDVRGLAESLSDLLNNDTLASIPMTLTGYVRRDCRKEMRLNPNNRKLFNKLKLSSEMYTLIEEAKRGGNTHAFRLYVGEEIEDIENYDMVSSYPYVMMCEYFPISPFTRINFNNEDQFNFFLETKCLLFRVSFIGLYLHKDVSVPYISMDKCSNILNIKQFNGRVLEADSITITLTEIDFLIIKEQYNWDKYSIYDCYFSERGELPKEIKNVIMKYFVLKCQLKNDDPYEYAISKERLNGIFGMILTNPVHDTIIYDGEWRKDKGSIENELEKFYHSKNSFLTYQWGIYVTAHARRNHMDGINMIGNDLVYVDTDSVKCIGKHSSQFEKLNKKIREKAYHNGAYYKYGGKEYIMGIWEREDDYRKFKTLGAKKYAYVDQKNELHITIAGVDKKKGAKELKSLSNMEYGFEFKEAGGLDIWYNDEQGPHYIEVDGEKILTASNAALLPGTYTLGVTEEFLNGMCLRLEKENKNLTLSHLLSIIRNRRKDIKLKKGRKQND